MSCFVGEKIRRSGNPGNMYLETPKKSISKSDVEVFEFLTDFKNFEQDIIRANEIKRILG